MSSLLRGDLVREISGHEVGTCWRHFLQNDVVTGALHDAPISPPS